MTKAKINRTLRPRRIFSDELKKKILKDIETNKASVLQVTREYQVSEQAVYKWLKKFSAHLHPTTTLVMQMDSEHYRTKELEKKIADLEAALGRKQIEIDFLNKLIEIADQDMGIDIKKNTGINRSSGSGKTKGKKGSA
jgi:transposase-like protein